MRGTLIVSDTEQTGKMRIAISLDAARKQTQVDIFPDGTGINITEVWSTVILYELTGRMEYLHQFVRESSNGLYEKKH